MSLTFLKWSRSSRILAYADKQPEFATLREAESWFRGVYQPFGPASDGFWTRMARTSLRRRGDGVFTTHYDPRITVQFRASPDELSTWDRFGRITLPVHVIRGETSDLLPANMAERMKTEGPRPEVTVIPSCGHAPSLSRAEDTRMVREMIGSMV
ncbi:alpha/beta fold hydrolase [Aliiruegeria lutimaris]|uniref:Alpha/beta hydrolase family protein n=1 Tax=Aliiruegeria lutimaris TaxID=571298 RepID=A0A1G8T9D6_9RHOB|nr:alpha/beta hydrolase [Aliiruegeria lutimaris]SDJ38259.1 hypothetical protein SAMN04488026_101681 [Aliiruegeria lutimaris]